MSGSTHQVIDRLGCLWPGDGAALSLQHGGPLAPRELVRYGVTNLGWAEIARSGERLRIICRPEILSEQTLGEVYLTLFHTDWRVISLSVLTDDWSHTILRDRADVLTLLGSIAGLDRIARLAHLPHLMHSEVEASSSPLFYPAQAAIQATRERSIEGLLPLLDHLFAGRWSLSNVDRDNGRVVLAYLGEGFTPFNPSWRAPGLRSRTLDGYADAEYAAWVAEQRKLVDDTNRPRFDAVDALVKFPGLGRSRLRYCRFTAPVETSDGNRLLLSAARTDSSVNLRKTG